MKIKWLGDSGYLPNVGEVHKNCEKNLPDNLANNYIKQGLAKEIKQTKTTVKKEAE